ncbi:hypothetical protein MASR2M69_02910 [Bacteroidota bacterium]
MLSDLVKFAKYTAPEQDCESAIPSAVRFVNSTFLEQIEATDNKVVNDKPSGGK